MVGIVKITKDKAKGVMKYKYGTAVVKPTTIEPIVNMSPFHSFMGIAFTLVLTNIYDRRPRIRRVPQ